MKKREKEETLKKEQPEKAVPVKQRSALSWLLNFWIFIPVFISFNYVLEYAMNMPYGDDYDAALDFLTKFNHAGFSEQVSLLFSQHGEHRILLDRIIFVLYYKLSGVLNFRHLIYIANLELVVVFLVLVHFIKQSVPRYWNVCSLFVAFGLFDAGNHENANWAMAGIQNYGVIMLFLLCLFFYSKNNKRALVAAVFCQFLLVFSSGSGSMATLLLILFTVLKKDKLKIILSAAASVLFIGLYFFHYSRTGGQTGTADTTIPFFFKLAGASLNFDYALPLGILILAVTFFTLPVTKKIAFKDNTLPLVMLLLFVLGSMSTIAYFRSNFSADSKEWFHASKYLIYPYLLIGLAYVFLFIKLKEKKFKWPVMIASALIVIFAYQQKKDWGISGFERKNYRLVTNPFFGTDETRAKEIAQKACAEGIYCHTDADE